MPDRRITNSHAVPASFQYLVLRVHFCEHPKITDKLELHKCACKSLQRYNKKKITRLTLEDFLLSPSIEKFLRTDF